MSGKTLDVHIYATLNAVLNYFLIVILTIFTLCRMLKKKIIEFCNDFSPATAASKSRNAITFPKKIPKHITVLLGLEEPSLKDLTNLVLWSLEAGISFISFYDYRGLVKQQETTLRPMIEEMKKPKDEIIWRNTPGDNFFRKIHVKIFTIRDGKPTITEICKNLVQKKEIQDFGIENLDAILRKSFEFPDADLGVCCGRTRSLYGYPPWQAKLTEFVNLETHRDIGIQQFVEVLEKFDRCEQRYGK